MKELSNPNEKPKVPETKTESNHKNSELKAGPIHKAPDPKDDLKTLPMPDVENGTISRGPHASRGSEAADPVRSQQD